MAEDYRDPLGEFVRIAGHYPPLSREAERKIITQVQLGDSKACELIVLHNLRYLIRYTRKFRGREVDHAELICSASLGIIEAAKKFDLDEDVRFLTFAKFAIKEYVLKAVFAEDLIRKPFNVSRQKGNVDKFCSMYFEKTGTKATSAIIAQALGMSEGLVKIILSEQVVSLNKEYRTDYDLRWTLSDVIPDRDELASERAEREDLVHLVILMLDTLVKIGRISRRHKKVYLWRFGLSESGEVLGEDIPGFAEIGRNLGVTRQYARELFSKTQERVLEAFGRNLERVFYGLTLY